MPRRTSDRLVFEYDEPAVDITLSKQTQLAAVLVLFLLAFVAFMRVMVAEAGTRTMTPFLYAMSLDSSFCVAVHALLAVALQGARPAAACAAACGKSSR